MAVQRRFGLAYRGSYASAGGRCPLADTHFRTRPMAGRMHSAICPFGDDQDAALLDEEFDDLACEPGVLLQLANQA
jgi:hypothetical protein